MGVPVVTLVGRTIVGRAGLSQLTNLGLPELVAHTPEEFVGMRRPGGRSGAVGGDAPHAAEAYEDSPIMDDWGVDGSD